MVLAWYSLVTFYTSQSSNVCLLLLNKVLYENLSVAEMKRELKVNSNIVYNITSSHASITKMFLLQSPGFRAVYVVICLIRCNYRKKTGVPPSLASWEPVRCFRVARYGAQKTLSEPFWLFRRGFWVSQCLHMCIRTSPFRQNVSVQKEL